MRKTVLIVSTATLLAAFAFAGCGTRCPSGPPIATDDRAITGRATPVGLPIIANDDAYGKASLDADSIDLDPSTPGTQRSVMTNEGGYMLGLLGDVTFVPADGFLGDAAIRYTITDSDGLVSEPAHILVTVQEVAR
jgi:mannan endo-1,4-beta-mannosidase